MQKKKEKKNLSSLKNASLIEKLWMVFELLKFWTLFYFMKIGLREFDFRLLPIITSIETLFIRKMLRKDNRGVSTIQRIYYFSGN